jgi:hypothetical protein
MELRSDVFDFLHPIIRSAVLVAGEVANRRCGYFRRIDHGIKLKKSPKNVIKIVKLKLRKRQDNEQALDAVMNEPIDVTRLK